jgi:hypothetical protein
VCPTDRGNNPKVDNDETERVGRELETKQGECPLNGARMKESASVLSARAVVRRSSSLRFRAPNKASVCIILSKEVLCKGDFTPSPPLIFLRLLSLQPLDS